MKTFNVPITEDRARTLVEVLTSQLSSLEDKTKGDLANPDLTMPAYKNLEEVKAFIDELEKHLGKP